MATITIKSFDGLAPKMSARLLADSKAQIAQEALLETGKLVPLKTLSATVKTLPASTATVWRFGNSASDTDSWMTFQTDASVIQSPVFDDTWKRLYWSQDDAAVPPRYAPTSALFSAGIGPTGTVYTLGLPAPTSAPVANGSTAALVPTATWEYMVTYTSSAGDSDPSPIVEVTAPVTRGANWTTYPVTLSSLPTPENLTLYTGKRVWTRKSGETPWWLAATFNLAAINTRDFTDNLTAASGTTYTQPSTSGIPRPGVPVASLMAPLTLGVVGVQTQYYYAYCFPDSVTGIDEWTGRYGAAYGKLSVAATAVAVDDSQTVTVTIPASAYTNCPDYSSFGISPSKPPVYAVFRKKATDAEPLLIGTVALPGSAVTVTLTDSGQAGTTPHFYTAYLGGFWMANGVAAMWGASQTAPASSATTSTVVTAADKVTYGYCQAFVNGATVGMPSDDSALVTVAEKGGTRQQGVRISIEAAPTGMVSRIYRRTVTVSGGVVTVTNAYKLLAELSAGVDSFEDTTLNTLSTAVTLTSTRPDGPTAAPGASCTVPGDPTLETRGYCYTYVSAYGEEGPPSPVSTLVDINPESSVTVSGLGTSAPTGAYNITTKRLYRSNAGSTAAAFQFVADIALATASYTDSLAASALGEVLPSESWSAPPTNMIGLCQGGNGIAAGFTLATGDGTSKLCFSEPYTPHAWPAAYQRSTGTKVVAMVPFGGNAWGVLTTSYPYVAVGTDPSSISLDKIAQPQSCTAKLSAVATDSGVIYASPDGLCLLSASGVQVVSDSLLTRAQWQAYGPTTMRSMVHNGRVLVFYTATVDGATGGVLIFDFTGKSAILTRSSITANGGYYDAITDQLYLIQGSTALVKWAGGADSAWTWKSKVYSLPSPTSFAWAQVEADSYPVTVKFFIGGTNNASVTDGSQLKLSPSGSAWTVTVTGREPFRMPSWVMYRDLEIQMSAATVVHSVTLAHSAQELSKA